jgi:multidrug efflux pump subunit AcrA (membrane-fusion protein)
MQQTVIIQDWLESQCGQVDGAARGVVMLASRRDGGLSSAASWPPGGRATQELEDAAQFAFDRQQPLSQGRLNGAERPAPVGPLISFPLQVKGKTIGALAVLLRPDIAQPPQSAVASLQRGAESFEAVMRQGMTAAKAAAGAPVSNYAPTASTPQLQARSASAPASPAPMPMPAATLSKAPSGARNDPDKTQELPASNSLRLLHLLATIEAHDQFKAAAGAFATELAEIFACDRVSVGLSGRRHVKVHALSHSTEFKANQGLLRDIGAAMEETIWQGSTLLFPQPDGAQPRVDRAHATLSQRHGSQAICTVLLVKNGKAVGAMMFERNRAEQLTRSDFTLCENIGALLGPLIERKHASDRAWPLKILAALKEAAAPIFGPGHRAMKIGVGSAVVGLIAAAFIPGDYRVSAPARLEGAVQRVMVAPGDGYLKQAYVRPGDRVKAGQPLAELADEDLKLELRKAQSTVAQLESSYGAALMKQDRTEVGIIFAKLEEARAQLQLVEIQLQRVKLTAPFDGVVITGDLTQTLGAPVKKGDSLMTLAPEHDFRVIVEVDERDVGDVHDGQPGNLALTALPGDARPFTVARITPVATAGQGRNYFEVEAKLTVKDADLRPGLMGVAKIEAGSRSLLWILTHRVYGWLRLMVWSWIG